MKLKEYEHVHEHGLSYEQRFGEKWLRGGDGSKNHVAHPVVHFFAEFALFAFVGIAAVGLTMLPAGGLFVTPMKTPAPRVPSTLLCSEIPGAGDIRLAKHATFKEDGGLVLVICDESNEERRIRLGYNPHAEIFEHYIDGFLWLGTDPLDLQILSKLPASPRTPFHPNKPMFPTV